MNVPVVIDGWTAFKVALLLLTPNQSPFQLSFPYGLAGASRPPTSSGIGCLLPRLCAKCVPLRGHHDCVLHCLFIARTLASPGAKTSLVYRQNAASFALFRSPQITTPSAHAAYGIWSEFSKSSALR